MLRLSKIKFRNGREAVDPRDGMLRPEFTASNTLQILLEGSVVVLLASDGQTIAPFSNCHGARLEAVDFREAPAPAVSGVTEGKRSSK